VIEEWPSRYAMAFGWAPVLMPALRPCAGDAGARPIDLRFYDLPCLCQFLLESSGFQKVVLARAPFHEKLKCIWSRCG
jgi:hypothetical protein